MSFHALCMRCLSVKNLQKICLSKNASHPRASWNSYIKRSSLSSFSSPSRYQRFSNTNRSSFNYNNSRYVFKLSMKTRTQLHVTSLSQDGCDKHVWRVNITRKCVILPSLLFRAIWQEADTNLALH